MKRYTHRINATENIYGMSVDRSFLIGRLEGYANVLFEHILKIVTAHRTGNAKFIDKWIGDIGKAVFNSSKYTIDGRKRLDADTYRTKLFGEVFGTEKLDMEYHLEDFKEDYVEYSNFEIDDELVSTLYAVETELRELIPNMISEWDGVKGIPIEHTKTVLRPIIRKYIPFETGKDNWYK